jgi:hypothetical protein
MDELLKNNYAQTEYKCRQQNIHDWSKEILDTQRKEERLTKFRNRQLLQLHPAPLMKS